MGGAWLGAHPWHSALARPLPRPALPPAAFSMPHKNTGLLEKPRPVTRAWGHGQGETTGRQEAETGTQKGIMTRAGWLRFLERCSQRQRGEGGEGTALLVSGRLRMK